jgi:ankyrin repeat protein
MQNQSIPFRCAVALVALFATLSFLGCAATGSRNKDKRWRTDQQGKTSLMLAVENGNLREVKSQIDSKTADVNARCTASATLTTNSLHTGKSAHYMTTLTQSNVNVGKQGNSALSLAILNKDIEIVRCLVKAGANTKANIVYINSCVIAPSGDPMNFRATDFQTYPERRATIIQLAELSGNPEIVAIIKQHR